MAVKKELVDELLKDADPKKVFGLEGRSTRSRRRWPSACSMPSSMSGAMAAVNDDG